jgi:hypothetical protein
MDRFSAYLLVRRFLRTDSARNRALAVEAMMEDLAARLGEPDASVWGLLGLLSQMDLEYAEHNPKARGKTARQQAELEGLSQEAARSLERWCHLASSTEEEPRPLLEDALFLADAVGALAWSSPGDDRSFSEEWAESLGQALDLRRQSGDPAGDRLDAALTRLHLEAMEAARLARSSLGRVEQDLR